MQVPAKCLASARRGRDADLRVIFTKYSSHKIFDPHNESSKSIIATNIVATKAEIVAI